jgi:hypothetical protein
MCPKISRNFGGESTSQRRSVRLSLTTLRDVADIVVTGLVLIAARLCCAISVLIVLSHYLTIALSNASSSPFFSMYPNVQSARL